MASTVQTLSRIFSDAHVRAIDVSDPLRSMGLVVVADHFRPWTEQGEAHAPLLLVQFHRV